MPRRELQYRERPQWHTRRGASRGDGTPLTKAKPKPLNSSTELCPDTVEQKTNQIGNIPRQRRSSARGKNLADPLDEHVDFIVLEHRGADFELFDRLHLDELDTGAAHAVVIGIAMRFLDDDLVLHAA